MQVKNFSVVRCPTGPHPFLAHAAVKHVKQLALSAQSLSELDVLQNPCFKGLIRSCASGKGPSLAPAQLRGECM